MSDPPIVLAAARAANDGSAADLLEGAIRLHPQSLSAHFLRARAYNRLHARAWLEDAADDRCAGGVCRQRALESYAHTLRLVDDGAVPAAHIAASADSLCYDAHKASAYLHAGVAPTEQSAALRPALTLRPTPPAPPL